MLKVSVEDRNDVVVLRCAGRIVRGDETSLLCAASRQQGRTVMLDLEGVETVDAAGIGMLVSLQAAGIYLRLMNPNDTVRDILKITQLDTIFEVCAPPPAREVPPARITNDELGPAETALGLTA